MSACEGVPFLLFLEEEDFWYPDHNSEHDPDRGGFMSGGSECTDDEGISDRDHSEDEVSSERTSLVSELMPKVEDTSGDTAGTSGDAKDTAKVAADATVDEEKPMTAGEANIKGYALLPQAFKSEHPEVIEDLMRNHIQVLNDHLTAGFALTVRRHGLILFEAEFRIIETDADSSNAPNSFRVFINVYNRSHSNFPPHWLNNTYGDFFNPAHFDCSCFYDAIEAKHLAIIEEMLSFPINFDLNYGHHKGRTILHFAVKRHQTALVELLLRQGANVEEDRVQPVYGYEPPEYDEDDELQNEIRCSRPLPLAAKKGFSDIVELLLRYNASWDYLYLTPLSLAYNNNHLETYKLLLEAEAKGKTDTYVPCVISKALWTCVVDHRVGFVELILCHFPVMIENNKLTFYFAFLHRDYGDEQTQCYVKMAAYGFELEYGSHEYSSMLLFGSIINNWAEDVKKLLEGGADVNQVCEIWRLKFLPKPTGSHWVLLSRRPDSKKEPALDILRAYSKYAPLHLAAAVAGEAVIQVLLDRGADMILEVKGRTPIYDACRTHNLTALKCLIANGANVQINPELIRYAAKHGSPQIMEFLLVNRTRSSIERKERSVLNGFLAEAAESQHVEVMNVLLKFGAQPSSALTFNCTRGCTVVPAGNHCATLQTVLDYSFTNVDLVHVTTKTTGFLDKYGTHWSRLTCSFCAACLKPCLNLLARFVIKLESTSLSLLYQNLAPSWHSEESLNEFRKNCEAEVARLKTERVGNSNITFYDILTKKVDRLASYAGHDAFVETMNQKEYMTKFPIYGSVLDCQFEKGYHRRNLLSRGKEICSKLSANFFKKLPDIFKEEVVNYLNNYNLEVLKFEFNQFTRSASEE